MFARSYICSFVSLLLDRLYACLFRTHFMYIIMPVSLRILASLSQTVRFWFVCMFVSYVLCTLLGKKFEYNAIHRCMFREYGTAK